MNGVVCTTLGKTETVVLPAPGGGEMSESREQTSSLFLPEASDEVTPFGEHVQ